MAEASPPSNYANDLKSINGKMGIPWPAPGYATDPKRNKRNLQLLRWYGLTIEDYEGMIWLQDNRCAVCDVDFDLMGHKHDPAVDHSHECCDSGPHGNRGTCGTCVRAIVCGPCNRALGFYESIRDRAETYLMSYG